MQESNFVSIFKSVASEVMGSKAVIRCKANLFYELTLNRDLELMVPNTKAPARGTSAFQTDLCIFELLNGIEFPRVVIEFKMSISSHDILTYSTKAGKHKKIYPGLGLLGLIRGKQAVVQCLAGGVALAGVAGIVWVAASSLGSKAEKSATERLSQSSPPASTQFPVLPTYQSPVQRVNPRVMSESTKLDRLALAAAMKRVEIEVPHSRFPPVAEMMEGVNRTTTPNKWSVGLQAYFTNQYGQSDEKSFSFYVYYLPESQSWRVLTPEQDTQLALSAPSTNGSLDRLALSAAMMRVERSIPNAKFPPVEEMMQGVSRIASNKWSIGLQAGFTNRSGQWEEGSFTFYVYYLPNSREWRVLTPTEEMRAESGN